MSLAIKEKPVAIVSQPRRVPRTTLRCVIYCVKDKVYIAECIDLDIMVTDANPDQAYKKLSAAIKGYLKVARSGDPTGLVPRPSPLSHRVRYHWFAIRAAVQTARRDFRLVDLSSDFYCEV